MCEYVPSNWTIENLVAIAYILQTSYSSSSIINSF